MCHSPQSGLMCACPDTPSIIISACGNVTECIDPGFCWLLLNLAVNVSETVAVGSKPRNDENPIPAMFGVNGTSRNNKRNRLVAETFQIRKHVVEAHIDDVSNILANNPSRPDFGNDSQHLRPEETVIRLASALPGLTKWLTWPSAANKVNWFGLDNCSDVSVQLHPRPVSLQHLLTVRVYLALPSYFHPCSFKTEIKTANAGEQTSYSQVTSPSALAAFLSSDQNSSPEPH